jgi:hypothetical protein
VRYVTDEGSRTILCGHCPNCDGHRNAEVLAEDTIVEEDKASGVSSKSTYSILRCLGCDRRYIRYVEACSEDSELEKNPETGELFWELKERVTYWPTGRSDRDEESPGQHVRGRPQWLWFAFEFNNPEFAALLKELYTALDNNLHVLATIGIRTVFDCAAQLLGCDPSQSFPEKLKELTAGNKIGGEEKEILSILTNAGNAAAHRGWKPTANDIEALMDALENFLHRAFVLKHNLRKVKQNIPLRPDSY